MDKEDEKIPSGYFVTVKEIHQNINNVAKEFAALKARMAAHEVVILIMTGLVVYLAQKGAN